MENTQELIKDISNIQHFCAYNKNGHNFSRQLVNDAFEQLVNDAFEQIENISFNSFLSFLKSNETTQNEKELVEEFLYIINQFYDLTELNDYQKKSINILELSNTKLFEYAFTHDEYTNMYEQRQNTPCINPIHALEKDIEVVNYSERAVQHLFNIVNDKQYYKNIANLFLEELYAIEPEIRGKIELRVQQGYSSLTYRLDVAEDVAEDVTEDDIKKINKALKIYNIYYQNTYSKKGTKRGFINLYDYLPYKEKMSVFEEFKVAKIVYSYSAQRIYQENKL